jgi:hypothetical protein
VRKWCGREFRVQLLKKQEAVRSQMGVAVTSAVVEIGGIPGP